MRASWLLVLLLAGCGTAVRVTDANTGAAVGGAQWRCGMTVIATSGSTGSARVDPLACDAWHVSAPGYESRWLCGAALAQEGAVALTPAWLHRFADGGSTATPAKQRLPTTPPCPCRP